MSCHSFFSCRLCFDEILKEVNANLHLEASNSGTTASYMGQLCITLLPPKLALTRFGPGAIIVVNTY